ncbi:hypothetical protein FSP39_012170 [Pinctada imbricata]|uniref:C2 domain-containing protein n=1 Tax=Pinctada imbricata TaxID=66713 RepID=A0AA89BQP3_PINIB|nr:hypothetical protein FSP39_012170 [Pinctada imbricata]
MCDRRTDRRRRQNQYVSSPFIYMDSTKGVKTTTFTIQTVSERHPGGQGDPNLLESFAGNNKTVVAIPDYRGFSDPYVVIQFCPEHIFPHVPIQETAIQKKTLNPTFDESFEFSVTAEQCKRRSAVLVFTVMDHDYVFQNDFAGEAYVSLADIPGVDGEDVTGFEALSVVTLPLMQPKHKGI